MAAEVITVVSLSANDSDDIWREAPANSLKVKPLTFKVAEPLVAPPDNPVPATTAVMSPTLVV